MTEQTQGWENVYEGARNCLKHVAVYGAALRRNHMKSLRILLAVPIAMPSLAYGAYAYTGEKLASSAKISVEQAIGIALKTRQGRIIDKELEREKGGTGLRYSFDIRSRGITYEVGIDAQTGAVLENAREGAHPD